MLDDYVRRILRCRFDDTVHKTPVDRMPRLGARLDRRIYLKREDLQPVFSFKVRGAFNKLQNLDDAQRARGVVAASAGNHAQGLALAASRLGIHARVVMPTITPEIKVSAVRRYGAEVILHGPTFDDALAFALEMGERDGLTFCHPFDDPDVIAGQGTIGMEMLQQIADPLDAIFVPVGGGGLIAGIAAYVKYVRPEIRIIGVEPEDAASLLAARRADRPVTLDHVGTFSDGTAVKRVGEHPWRIARGYVDDVITCTTDEICAAVKAVFEDTRSICEPAGALSVAGLRKYVQTGGEGQVLAAVNCGANINFDRLRHISERTELGEGREAILAVTIPECPGSFRAFCSRLGTRNITEFNYRRDDPRQAHIFVGVQLQHPDDRQELIASLEVADYPVSDLTTSELAKIHIRHMVGGRSPSSGAEHVFTISFPERPGALLAFLTQLPSEWSITGFHYRNHGADFGRVLMALQAPGSAVGAVDAALAASGYDHQRVSDDPAVRLFLGDG
jgi:threonine dehydratase